MCQRHALVMGASMAGLLTARALHRHFERVTVIERDTLAHSPGTRKGVPQSRQTHGMLAGGWKVLQHFFPGIDQELAEQGAIEGDVTRHSLWYSEGGFHLQFDSGMAGICSSRPLLESALLGRVRALPNIVLRDQVTVAGFLTDGLQQHVHGLRVIDRRSGKHEMVQANLVVDCTGCGSRTPARLAELGCEPPLEERVDVDLEYATQHFRKRVDDFHGAKAVILTPQAPNKRFAVALAIEGDQWSLTLGGMLGERAPDDASDFREYARGLPSPSVHAFLENAEPVSKVVRFTLPGSLRRRYERLRRFPRGLLVLGDALCSFNPIYGQGMTVAAMEANVLDEILVRGTSDLAGDFFRRACRLIDVPWQIAVTTDFRFRETRGCRPRLAGITNHYLKLVHRAAQTDPAVGLAFHRVTNLLSSPRSLCSPSIMLRVLAKMACRRQRPAIDGDRDVHASLAMESPPE